MVAGQQALETFRGHVVGTFGEPGQRHDDVLGLGLIGSVGQLLPLYEDIQRPSDVEGQRVRLHAEETDVPRRWRPPPNFCRERPAFQLRILCGQEAVQVDEPTGNAAQGNAGKAERQTLATDGRTIDALAYAAEEQCSTRIRGQDVVRALERDTRKYDQHGREPDRAETQLV